MDQILIFVSLNVTLVLLLAKNSLHRRSRNTFSLKNFNNITNTWNFTVEYGVRLLLYYLQENVFAVDESKERDAIILKMPEICLTSLSILSVYGKLDHVVSLYIFFADEHLNQYIILKEYQCMRFYIFIHGLILSWIIITYNIKKWKDNSPWKSNHVSILI